MTQIKIEGRVLSEAVQDDHVQFLPFSMKLNGESEVTARFTQHTEMDKTNNCLVNSFRGYPLDGMKAEVPEGFQGLVLDTGRKGLTDEKESVRAISSFKAFTYWNYDKVPGETDNYQQALQWTKVAAALHGAN